MRLLIENKLGASTLEENKLAELVIERVPSIEKCVWFHQELRQR